MKLIDRIAYITFWINIFFILFVFIFMPIIFINVPDSFEYFAANKGLNPYNLTFIIFNLAAVFHWGYCIWFLFKYDRYSKSIIPLFFFNVLYAPIYYYRVKIKKRPLRNEINKPEQIVHENKSIDENEFVELTRENIIGVIQLWTSKDEQLDYQKSVPDAQVSSELFGQWNDFYTPNAEVMTEAFNSDELDLLNKFDEKLTMIKHDLNGKIPDISVFVGTVEWKEINSLANRILTDIK